MARERHSRFVQDLVSQERVRQMRHHVLPHVTSHPLKRRTGARGWPSLLSSMSCLQQRLSQNHPCPCHLAPSGDHNGEGGENVVRREDLPFLRQDQIKLLRQRIRELEATLRDQQQKSRMWQKRLDLVLDQVLSNECIEDKDYAYYTGKGTESPLYPLPPHSHQSTRAHARTPPAPLQKLPALLSRRRRLLLKKTSDPLSTIIVHHATHSGVHALHYRRSWRPRRGGHPGTKHGEARSHHRRTVPSRATRYPHCLPLLVLGSHQALRDMGET